MNKIFPTFFIIATLFGQTNFQKESLKSQSELLIKKSQRAKKNAEEKAINMGWPVKGKLENGEEYSLQRLAPNGKPIYYCTENINSAKTISTNQVWAGGESQLFLSDRKSVV